MTDLFRFAWLSIVKLPIMLLGSTRRCLMRLSTRAMLVVLALVLSLHPSFAEDMTVDGVPLPADAKVAPADTPLQRQWSGVWLGGLDGNFQKHILLVEAISADGSADVTFAIGDSPYLNVQRQWSRHKATVSERSLSITGADLSVTYEVKDKDTLEATYFAGGLRRQATMARGNLAALTAPGAVVDWLGGRSEFLQTDLVENGKPIRLEAVIFKPSGRGPFPLAVVNHGVSGRWRGNPAILNQTWFAIGLATFLNERGWLVAFPQRRGRGWSDGRYDEGFSPDRPRGYTCEVEPTLDGAKRALSDIDAAVTALRRRLDVAASRMLMAGWSRGGILSVVYAGDHADQTMGVINFVGGILIDSCAKSSFASQTLFKQGARFSRPTLWLYGRNDPAYSITHSQENFSAFRDAGGQGSFLEYDVPGGNGHIIIYYPSLWSTPVGDYLDSLAVAQK